MKKENFPWTPYKKKAKGKEASPIYLRKLFKPSKPARARRLACTCTYEEAGASVDEIIGNCFGQKSDVSLWAWYCRHFDRNRIVDMAYNFASLERQHRIRDGLTAFQDWLSDEYAEGGDR